MTFFKELKELLAFGFQLKEPFLSNSVNGYDVEA